MRTTRDGERRQRRRQRRRRKKRQRTRWDRLCPFKLWYFATFFFGVNIVVSIEKREMNGEMNMRSIHIFSQGRT